MIMMLMEAACLDGSLAPYILPALRRAGLNELPIELKMINNLKTHKMNKSTQEMFMPEHKLTNEQKLTVSTSASLEQNGMLVAAFPGTGKSYYCSNGDWSQYVPEKWCTDSDSSKFDKSNFPENYIEHIKEKIKQGYAMIFISSHKENEYFKKQLWSLPVQEMFDELAECLQGCC